jgi:hypothetical protein
MESSNLFIYLFIYLFGKHVLKWPPEYDIQIFLVKHSEVFFFPFFLKAFRGSAFKKKKKKDAYFGGIYYSVSY